MKRFLKAIALLAVGFLSGTLFITVPYNKNHAAFCFKDEQAGVVKASHLDAIMFYVYQSNFTTGAPGALAEFKLEKLDEIVACPVE